MVAAGVTTPVQGIAHIIGQVGGGIVATLLLLVIVPGHVLHGKALGANAVPEGVHLLQAFIGAPPPPPPSAPHQPRVRHQGSCMSARTVLMHVPPCIRSRSVQPGENRA